MTFQKLSNVSKLVLFADNTIIAINHSPTEVTIRYLEKSMTGLELIYYQILIKYIIYI
jgi:hypothetical protein